MLLTQTNAVFFFYELRDGAEQAQCKAKHLFGLSHFVTESVAIVCVQVAQAERLNSPGRTR